MCWTSPTAGSRSRSTRAEAEAHTVRREPTNRRLRATKEREGPSCFLQVARLLVALDRYPGESCPASGLVTVGPVSAGSSSGSRTDRDSRSTLVEGVRRAYGTLVHDLADLRQIAGSESVT